MIKFKRARERFTIQGQDTESMAKNIFLSSCTVGFIAGPIIGLQTHSLLNAFLFAPLISLLLEATVRLGFFLERNFTADQRNQTLKWLTRFGIRRQEMRFDEISVILLDTYEKHSNGVIPLNNPLIHRIRLIGADKKDHLVMENNDEQPIRDASQKIAWMLQVPIKDEIKR